MPYTKKRTRKSYKRRGAARGKVYGAAAGQLWKDVKMLKNLINVEFKVKDLVTTANPNTVGSPVLLNGLTKGDDYNNRDGRQVRWKSIQMLLRATMHASATNTTIRYWCFLDKQPNAAAPTSGDLVDVSASSPVDAFRNLSNRKRFVFLKEFRFTLDTDNSETTRKWYRKIDLKTIYDDSDAGNISDITTASLFFYLVSDESTNLPTVVLNHRLRFIDN